MRELQGHEKVAPDGTIHWWACRIFCPPRIADASLGCDCDTAKEANKGTPLSVLPHDSEAK